MPDINFIKEVVERAFDPFSELPAIYAKKENRNAGRTGVDGAVGS